MAHDFVDPYLDADASILRNLVGATNYDELLNAEGELVALRTNEFLEKLPLRPSGSMDDFLFIHRFLFQDIYDWAGMPRTVEIRKSQEGSEYFLPSPNIAMGFAWAQDELRKDNWLRDLPKEEFTQRLAYHFDNYNFIHPFRDGNGRVGRLIVLKECLRFGLVPFIIEDSKKMYYYRGLSEWDRERGYLTDTCLNGQDAFKRLMSMFDVRF